MFAETVGLDDSFDFFSWEESRPWRGLRCRAGGAILLQYCGNETQPWSNFESNRGGSSMQGIPAFPVSFFLEGVSQMVYILPAKETPFPFFSGTPFFGTPCFLFFCFFLALQRLARLKCNLEPNCKHI